MPANPSPAATRRPLGWLGVVAIAGAILGLPALPDLGEPPRHPFNARPLLALEKARPRGVLIGDSMLETRIDPQVLNAAAGERWAVLAQPGSSSAMWYLMLKNLVAVQAPPPRTVIIFFRDRQLTLPAHRTKGGSRKTLESYMRGPERLLGKILQAGTRRQQPWPERAALALYPMQWRREPSQEKIQSWAMDLAAGSRESQKIRDAAHTIFGLRNLRPDRVLDAGPQDGESQGLDPEPHDLETAVGASFLPPLLGIAQEKKIRLVFFRVKRKPRSADEPAHESPTLPAYTRELRAYLEKAGAQLVDETRDADITPDFYEADDHIETLMMKAYTEMFWRKVGPLLPPPAR